jgi:hypothetical protein
MVLRLTRFQLVLTPAVTVGTVQASPLLFLHRIIVRLEVQNPTLFYFLVINSVQFQFFHRPLLYILCPFYIASPFSKPPCYPIAIHYFRIR